MSTRGDNQDQNGADALENGQRHAQDREQIGSSSPSTYLYRDEPLGITFLVPYLLLFILLALAIVLIIVLAHGFA